MSKKPSELWSKLYTLLLKSFRGLICEKKEGGWELSKGNVAFWVVLVHCMYVWNKVGEIITQATTETVSAIVLHADVSDGELYTLWALLGYAGAKLGKSAAGDLAQGFASWKKSK